ncbi:hypothetical protein [Paracoccus benzoatiresistens]|jgi:hypothetical protein|uniref:Uncharacterized protein n=1 Tax=Paracoccus benzoatiresistens TaxID=2997341 RepID=A0ABT4IYV6_9RHOB|nr:hypothetical protein [Paracoccus sp. EF6]MCZ0960048.1 hypothetical protein [Paracoccus sp. EF6]
MVSRSFQRHVDPDPSPVIDFGVPYMFDIQTELHLRRAEREAATCHDASRATRAILIAANLSALSLLAATLL